MGAISDLWKSERGIVAIAGLILVTVMFALARITADQWEALFKWIFVGYTGSKTVTGGIAMLKGSGEAGGPKPPNGSSPPIPDPGPPTPAPAPAGGDS